MKMKPFDLGNFKKVSEDSSYATLKHPEGHEIRVSKKALNPKLIAQLKKLPMNLAEGTPDEPIPEYSPSEESNIDREPSSHAMTINGDPLDGPYAKVAQDQQEQPPAEAYTNIPIAQPAKQEAAHLPTAMNPGHLLGELGSAYKGQEAAAAGLGQAQAQQATAQQDVARVASDQMADLHAHVMNHNNALLGDADMAAQEIKAGKIRPNAYLEDMSTAGKISTAIGLILGGMGGGILGQPNAALGFIEKQITNNIEAQKANLNNKGTLFNAYLSKFGSSIDAEKMTRNILEQKYAYDMMDAALKSGDQAQIQKANMIVNQLKEKAAKDMYPMAVQQGLMDYLRKTPNVDPSVAISYLGRSGLLNEAQAKGANEELSKAKETEALRQATYQSYTNLINLQQRGLWSPARRAAEVNLLAGKIEVQSNHRYNSDSAQALADSMLPKRLEGSDTTAYKPHLIDRFFDAERANETYLPSLAPFGISVPKGKVGNIQPNKLTLPGYPKRAK